MEMVGKDGTHQTFFEMLGNWSFDLASPSQEKAKVMEAALDFLIKDLNLDLKRMTFTYFMGENSLGVKLDQETKELWQQLGVSENQIIPKSKKDNFWQMGDVGPCGPCTEIHYDDTEIWNIVFMQKNLNPDGSLT